MKRGKELAVLCHCVLNQNSVVHPLARNRGAMIDVTVGLMQRGFGIYQLPCPEMSYGGLRRCPMSHQEYDKDDYRNLCRELTERVLQELERFVEDGCKIRALVGIGGSPTCSIRGCRGHFMTALLSRLSEYEKELHLIEIPPEYEGDD